MKQNITLFIAVFIAIGSLCYFAFISGEKHRQDEIELRVINSNQEHYSREEIEILLFNEPQA